MESLWFVIDSVAPALLIAVIVWAFFHNRKASRVNVERGARELREELEQDEARRGAP